jgi:2-polyprenyl-3-methyl-5-hydroxy-6-metoxy-1,4-benzoquinol methylase
MLAKRALSEEQMDALDLDSPTYARILSDLARVNSVTMARRPTLNFLKQASLRQKSLRILDVGFGDGDMLRSIAQWGARSGVALELVGIDLNPKSAVVAQAATPKSLQIDWRTGDYAALSGEGFDLILSSLVAHHMTYEQLLAFLRFMDKEARLGWFVNDLHRHGFAWMGYPLLARLLLCHRIVREDGQLSIARSYRPAEWPPLLAEAGVSGATVDRVFPFRLCVSSLR